MDRIKTRTYYIWSSQTGFKHWILVETIVTDSIEIKNILNEYKNIYGDVGPVFATINTPKEYLILLEFNYDIYEFVQE